MSLDCFVIECLSFKTIFLLFLFIGRAEPMYVTGPVWRERTAYKLVLCSHCMDPEIWLRLSALEASILICWAISLAPKCLILKIAASVADFSFIKLCLMNFDTKLRQNCKQFLKGPFILHIFKNSILGIDNYKMKMRNIKDSLHPAV